ncbi:MAG TPA: hypothetical protein VGJ73_20260 [Verrucomicrobiae bacterium]
MDDIRSGIYEIRNLLGPIGLKLDSLELKVSAHKVSFDSKTFELEAKIAANAVRISEQGMKSEEHSSQIASLFEQVKWIQGCLMVSRNTEKKPGSDG